MFKNIQLPIENLWIFGYGSLMWNPGFPYEESKCARIYGYHRSLCIRSVRYRGTSKKPGLVFGLDRGGSCNGMAFRISTEGQQEIMEYLWDREMLNDVYEPRVQSIVLEDARKVKAIAFVVQRFHPSYINNLTTDQAANIVATAYGQRGANLDYVLSTISQLESIGFSDKSLRTVCQLAISRSNSNSQSLTRKVESRNA